jgi:dATP pyrophosphohydrolase
MARAPYNTLVILHRQNPAGEIEHALFKRVDLEFWQPVTGGGEDGETPVETAQRETLEETGLDLAIDSFFQLQMIEYVPVKEFGWRWSEEIYVIPQYCFAVDSSGGEIQLSREHKRFCWLRYERAYRMLKYDGNRTALWELNQRLRGLGPRD